ncbi:MAG TPA: hypothetical protein VF208_12010 [Candidatus Binatia bacterium]
MKSCSDLIAHGLALVISIVTLALAVEVKQDVRANPLERRPQTLKDLRQERKELKIDRKERRLERRDRRKGKSVSKAAR